MPLGTLAAPPGFTRSPGGVYAKRTQYERCALHGESSRVLNVLGNPYGKQNQFPSQYQSFPSTADELLKWLGDGLSYPAGVGLANVLAIYLANTASPLVDSLGLGPNLVAAAGPLTGRECVGLGQAGSFISKVGVEILDNTAGRFADAGAVFMDVADGTIRSFALVGRFNANAGGLNRRVLGKEHAVVSWSLTGNSTTGNLMLNGAAASATVTPFAYDGSWHCIFGVIDCTVAGSHQLRLYTDMGDGASALFATSLANAGNFMLGCTGAFGNSTGFQTAYLACLDVALTSAMRANFWRHGQLPIPFLHARTSPMIAPITASRVAAWAGGNVGQPCLAYDASLASAANGNGLGSGYMAEDGITFEPIGSTDVPGNTRDAGTAHAAVDGPSGMRDAVRVTMAGAYATGGTRCYAPPAPYVAIVGASNVPWASGGMYKQATNGATARHSLYFTGDAGGAEGFMIITDNATPVDWMRGSGTCTPTRAGQTAMLIEYGAAALNNDCDWGEFYLVKNRTTAPLAWRRVGTAAAAATVLPAYEAVNTGNAYFSPLRGRIRLNIGQFQGTAGATFLRFGVPGAAGSLLLDYNAGQLRLQVWDAAAALAVTILAGPANAGRHAYEIAWDSLNPLPTLPWAYAVIMEAGAILGQWLAPWAAANASPTPLWIGSNGGVNAARCLLELA